MALYKLTKGTVSVIRMNLADVRKAEADGYKLDGEVNEAYEVTNPYPRFDEAELSKTEEPKKRGRPAKEKEE